MRKTIIALAAGCLLGAGLVSGIPLAEAQGAPTPPPPPGMDGTGPGMHRPMMDGMRHGPMHHRGGMFHRMRAFALVYPAPDRALSGADVQKIAEAFLLFNGNHSWKVADVTEQPEMVTFALATPDGTAIAHFSMNRHTGRLNRVS